MPYQEDTGAFARIHWPTVAIVGLIVIIVYQFRYAGV